MYVHIFMSKMDIDLRACACQCVKFSLYTCLCMNICKCMVWRIKTLGDGVMIHWNASTSFRLVDEPTQHDEDGANTITCNMRKYSLCNGRNNISSLYICQNDTIVESSCYNPHHVAKGRRTKEKSENYICICCAVLREPTIFMNEEQFQQNVNFGKYCATEYSVFHVIRQRYLKKGWALATKKTIA